jgi:5-(carboxyamino)imidazole ribonucleotide synthase
MAFLPGSTIGVIGGGQLGRMLALEARRMDYRVLVLDPGEDAPAAQVADGHIRAPLDDVDAARELARRSDVITLEWENADAAMVRAVEEIAPVRPGAHVLEIAQHRVREKDAVSRLGVPTAPYRAVDGLGDLERALAELGTPAVLKTARGGYDGKGQRVLRDASEAAEAIHELGGGDLILEGFVDFRLEASVVCARGPDGEIATFPVVENIHERGILDFTIAPARVSGTVARRAREIGEALVEGLDVVGLLAVELFVGHDDALFVNELAPRPHNSGHYTWEACSVSQFEQQLRAVCGLPLGRAELLRPACMANLLGEHLSTPAGLSGLIETLALPLVSLHLYGKREARRGRKMGHLTALADTPDEAFRRAEQARALLCGTASPA